MIRYMIKNNFKLMCRNKWSLVILLLGPILVIAMLSSAFAELMKSYEGVDAFEVGYRIEKESVFSEYITAMKEAGTENEILFHEYPEGEPKDLIENNGLAGFVEFKETEYVVYESADCEVEGITLEYFLSRIMRENTNASLEMLNGSYESEIQLPVEKLESLPAIDSKDYYGIIYIVYFCWCGLICATGVLSNEKKYGIERKFQVSNLSDLQIYLGKLIPTTMTVVVGMGAAAILTIILFEIHWGNPLLSALIIFLIILSANSYGLMIYQISNNLAITIIVVFTSVWCMGFLGGSFETYMYSAISDTLKQISPIYYENRALVELSCMGHSEYVSSAILSSIVITIVCSVITVFVSSIKRRGRA